MKSGVSIVTDKLKAFQKSLEKLTESRVLVGVPSKTAERKDDEPLNNAEIGYIQENGEPANNLPARPFLIPGVKSVEKEVARALGAGAASLLIGDTAGFRQAQDAAGLIATSAVKKKITDGPFVPLAPATISRRKSKGRTGIKPLIDTGQLRQSITYIIRGN